MTMTPEDRAKRKIGGSMIAKILKKSKWGTPLDAYLELTGERPSVDKTGEDIDRGNFLEPALREWASKKTGLHFRQTGVEVLKEWDWATVSPDGVSIDAQMAGIQAGEVRVIERPDVLLEIKAPRRDAALEWGDEGSDEVPTDALLQTHWGMMVTQAGSGIVASLLGGELRIYRVKRDLVLEAKMLAAAKSFVTGHVLPRVPPPPEYGDDHNVLFRHPRQKAPNRPWDSLTEQERYVVGTYLEKYHFTKEAERSLEGWEPVVKEVIGDAGGIDAPLDAAEWQKLGGLKRVDWADRAGSTRWKELAMSLMAQMPSEEVEELKRNFAGTPTRSLRPYFVKEKK